MSFESQSKRLETICTFSSGGTPSKKNPKFWGGDIPWVSGRDMKSTRISETTLHITKQAVDESSSAKMAPAHCLLILVRGMGLAHGAQITELMRPCAFNQDIRAIHPNDDLHPRYLVLMLRTAINMSEHVLSNAAHGTLKIDSEELRNVELPVPPLAEQKRIVSILDEAFSAIAKAKENAEKNLLAARELFESYLNRVFTQQGSEWQETTVADVARKEKGSMRTGPFGSQLLKREFVDSGIAVLGIDNAVHNEFRWGKRRFITPEKYKTLSRFTVQPGDVVITIMGTCGRCAIVPDDIPLTINSKHLCCITLDQKKCLPEYLHAYFLHHPVAKQFLKKRAKGAIMAGLNMGIIKELPLQLPSIPIQKNVIGTFQKLRAEFRRLETIYTQKLANLDELKQSILQKAFTGQLTDSIVQKGSFKETTGV